VSAIHEGNQSSSDEEADIVAAIMKDLLQSGVAWVDKNSVTRPLSLNDVLIVSPYNAQAFNLAARLPTWLRHRPKTLHVEWNFYTASIVSMWLLREPDARVSW
jgi:hypothetical protein